MTSKSTPMLSSVLHVSYSDSPFCTDDVLVSKLTSLRPNFCSATSKLHLVRVEFSKNKFETNFPSNRKCPR